MKIFTRGKIDIALILIIVVISSIIAGAVYFLDRVEGADDEARRVAAEELEARREKEVRDRQAQIDESTLDFEPNMTQRSGDKVEDVVEIEPISDDAVRMSDLALMSEALDRYRELEGFYPETVRGNLFDIGTDTSPCVELIVVGVLASCPKDPLAPEQTYRYGSNGETYKLTALLDNQESEECDVIDSICVYSAEGGAA